MKKAKKKLEIVFHLIKKMSQSDKRYFKLNNQTYKTETDFLKLFDYLNTQDKLNLPALEKFFEKKNITNPNLCIKYLHNKIMNTLQDKARKSLNNKIQVYNENIEQHLNFCNTYLYADLPEYALKEIHKAEEIALRLEDYNYLLRIYRVHRDILTITHMNHDKYEELREDATNKLEWALQQLLLINGISNITRKILFKINPNALDYQKNFDKIQEYAIRMDKLPTVCQQFILSAKAHHCYLKEQHAEMCAIQKQMIELWESIPYERWNLNEYIITWSNLLIISTDSDTPRSKTNDYFAQYIELPKKHPVIFKGPTEIFRRTYFILRYSVEILIILNYEEYSKIYEMEQRFLERLTKFVYVSTLANVVQLIFLRIALVHLILGNYERSNYWLSQYHTLPDTSETNSWNSTCEILNVMIHYDHKNYIYLKSKIRNLKRQWQKEKPQSPNALVLLGLIQKTLLKSNEHKISEIWESGLKEMHEAEKSRALYFIKLSKWVERKINAI